MKRCTRRYRLTQTWSGSKVGVNCELELFDVKSNRFVRMHMRVTAVEIRQLALGTPVDAAWFIRQRFKTLLSAVRHQWRRIVLGTNYRQRLQLARRKHFAMQQWDKYNAQLHSPSSVEYERRLFAESLERDWGPTPKPVFD